MKNSVKYENIIQGKLIKHLGKAKIEALPLEVQMKLFAEWRDIINDWKEHNEGASPNAQQMEWILGVWHKMSPFDYIATL